METGRQDQARRVGLREGRRERELSRVSPAKIRCGGSVVGISQPNGFTTLSPDPFTQTLLTKRFFPQNFLQDSSRSLRLETEPRV